jgi:cytosine/uracil/thiamine/allantoin permease
MRPLYDYAWFVGFAVAFLVYLVMTRASESASTRARA